MKIKKVDDKPMVIHTKKKAKIHMHEPKKAKIKGSNIYTVQRGPKIASAKINDTGKKKSYRKSTIHQAESICAPRMLSPSSIGFFPIEKRTIALFILTAYTLSPAESVSLFFITS